ncbi:MAG: flagellin [Phycisphaerales bacterium]|nr:flagellin [Phycisphaerales bacterium]
MARINTNISSLIAQSSLNRSYKDLDIRLERLSTGLRINRGADDPAGLITSERLRSEMASITKAVSNSERAGSVIATTEGALSEISEMLNSIKGLIIEAANTGGVSQEELEANQLQIDSAIDAITRISNTASFAGLQLLNGTLDYLTSGVPTSAIANANILGASFGNASNVPVNVQVLGSAQTASITLTADYPGTTNDGTLLSSITLEISGNDGVQVLQFVSGQSIADVVSAVNKLRDSTGVEASLVSAGDLSSGMVFTSIEYGSKSFVSVRKIGEAGEFFDTRISSQRDSGRDVTAAVNGILATGKGLEIAVKTPALNVELLLTEDFAQDTANTKTFYITGGGAQFQLGPTVNVNQQINFGVRSVAASRLGATMIDAELQYLNSLQSGGTNSLDSGNFLAASKVIDSSIDEVAVLRGQLGAIERNTIQPNMRSLQVALENITASESKIRDADFALETSLLTRAQILVQAGTAVLATANSTAQSVLQLLG